MNKRPDVRGRGSSLAPANRFLAREQVLDLEQVENDPEFLASLENVGTEYLPDDSQSVVTENQSPDIGFRFSINPYRGCSHGCSYCYARPSHEYLGLNAGIDFETKILVKHDAARLLREFLCRPSWDPELIVLSGVTDPYQPAERRFQLTRACLEVAAEARQPVGVITKNALVVRDLDLLGPMAAAGLVHVNISVTTLNQTLARVMEPRTSAPAARLRAISALSAAGVPVRVMVAPIIPGLNDTEIPTILAAAREAGASAANYTIVRLPLAVKPVFLDWLERTQAGKQAKIESLIRSVRGGKLNESQFGQRMRGKGEIGQQIDQMFKVFTHRYELDGELPPYDFSHFEPPRVETGQLRLF
jgi:DNA repair photolyase